MTKTSDFDDKVNYSGDYKGNYSNNYSGDYRDNYSSNYSATGYARLAKSLIDIVKEQQAKLGYRKEIVRLYYPSPRSDISLSVQGMTIKLRPA